MKSMKIAEVGLIFNLPAKNVSNLICDDNSAFSYLKRSRFTAPGSKRWLYPTDAVRALLENRKSRILKELREVNRSIDRLDEWEDKHEKKKV